jgi:hypothetical protein
MYCWGGKFWSVPEGYVFPKKMLLKQAWTCWLIGQPANRVEYNDDDVRHCPIKPFRRIQINNLPAKLRDTFLNDIEPFMKLMSEAPSMNLPESDCLDPEVIEAAFDIGIEHVKSVVEYIFVSDKWGKWSVSYLCKNNQYSKVMIHGTESDKLRAAAKKGIWSAPRRRRER